MHRGRSTFEASPNGVGPITIDNRCPEEEIAHVDFDSEGTIFPGPTEDRDFCTIRDNEHQSAGAKVCQHIYLIAHSITGLTSSTLATTEQ